ncbi:MAG: signal transduction histidine kinase [Patiriisocius sp.]|jgi:signal transduction histidine kinase
MLCYWYEQPTYLFFAPDLPGLLYYSHIPVTIIALLVGFFVFFNARHLLANRLLFLITICFSAWTVLNLTTWTNINSEVLLFSWSFLGFLQALISILSIYFIHAFLTGEDLGIKTKATFFLLLAPVLFFAPSNLSLRGFNISDCDAFGFEGALYTAYFTLLGGVAMVWILTLLLKHFKTASSEMRKQIILMGIGIEFFLFSFFTIVYFAGILTEQGYFEDSSLELYGMFGMAIFMVFMGFLIVRFKSFSVGLLAPQALVVVLIILVASQFTFASSTVGVVLTLVTLVFTAIAGLVIIRNVKKEISQREQIEGLAVKLKKANKRLKELDQMKSEFVSIASHQLRSPLTSIRGYASMILEGSYGKLSAKAEEVVGKIAESSTFMASSIEDYLNVSRIEAGNMKYELTDFNLKDEAEHVVDDKRQEAMKKGLLITFKSDLDRHGIVNADIGKTRQILHNLINNSLKYTPRGTITLFVHDDAKKKKIYVDIIDSGIGMKPEELEDIFGKFERAHNANQTNVTGTGLGLFVARKMARHMNGEVTARSDGPGHGSTFRLEMPLHM